MPLPLLIGISGPSSSGKSTLTNHLLRLLHPFYHPSSFTPFALRQDDYYLPTSLIPQTTYTTSTGETKQSLDWDTPEALDLDAFVNAAKYAHDRAAVPPSATPSKSQPEPESEQDLKLPVDIRQRCTERLNRAFQSSSTSASSSSPAPPQIILLEGFLLYPYPPSSTSPSLSPPQLSTLTALLTLRIFLPLSRPSMLARRGRREPYPTPEGGTWYDPEGYVEGVVWRNYLRDMAGFFRNGDAEADVSGKGGVEGEEEGGGEVDLTRARESGVDVWMGGDEEPIERVVEWAVDVLALAVERWRGDLDGVKG